MPTRLGKGFTARLLGTHFPVEHLTTTDCSAIRRGKREGEWINRNYDRNSDRFVISVSQNAEQYICCYVVPVLEPTATNNDKVTCCIIITSVIHPFILKPVL